MAKKAKSADSKPKVKPAAIDVVEITYDLFDLPTAQHKAGLAGLVLQIQSMRDRRLPTDSIPEIVGEVGTTAVTIRFTEKSVQKLFDELYAATWERSIPSEKPRKKRDKSIIPHVDTVSLTKVDPKTNKQRVVTGYIYLDATPELRVLKDRVPTTEWLKLYQQMIYFAPREKPASRDVYDRTASGEPYKEGKKTFWQRLCDVVNARQRNEFSLSEVEGGLLLGSQEHNAEAVCFKGRSEQNLLLHFWPLTILIFVPQLIKNDGTNEFVGFSLAIPEVSDLENFCHAFPELLERLPKDLLGYRPRAAVIDLPEQSALEFHRHLGELVDAQVQQGKSRKIAASVSSIEYLHLVKLGNNVKSQSAGRIAPSRDLMTRYFDIMRRGEFRNPLFRAGLLRSLLDSIRGPTPWYASFGDLFQTRPWPLFVCCDKTPRKLPWFASDAATQFDIIANDLKDSLNAFQSQPQSSQENRDMTDDPVTTADGKPRPQLETLIYGLVRNYVNRKTENKCGTTWDNITKRPKIKDEKTGRERLDIPKDYSDAREKIVSDVFLAMRSRREQDFVDYFTATICSVGQYLPADDFPTVAQALIQEPDKVKTITLLALSANS